MNGQKFYEGIRKANNKMAGMGVDTMKAGQFTVQTLPPWEELDDENKQKYELLAKMVPAHIAGSW